MSDMLKGAIEDNVLCTLVYSEQYAARVALEITSDLFSNRQYQRIAEVALEYYSKFGAPPKEHIKDLLEREVTRGEYAPLFNRILDDMAGLQETLQPDYVISQLDNFIGTRKLTHIVNEAADLLHEGRLEEALEAIRKTTYATKSDEGAWLADTQKWFSFLNKTPSDIISCGIPTLDERGIHLTKGQKLVAD
jgi:replicative DNA helicase